MQTSLLPNRLILKKLVTGSLFKLSINFALLDSDQHCKRPNINWMGTPVLYIQNSSDIIWLNKRILKISENKQPLNSGSTAASLYRRSTSGTRVMRMSMSVSLDCAMETNISDSSTPSYLANRSFSLWLLNNVKHGKTQPAWSKFQSSCPEFLQFFGIFHQSGSVDAESLLGETKGWQP